MEQREFKQRKRSQRNKLASFALFLVSAVEVVKATAPALLVGSTGDLIQVSVALGGLAVNHFMKK